MHFISYFGKGTFLDYLSWLFSYYPFLILVLVFLFMCVVFFDRKKWKKIIVVLLIAIFFHFFITELMFKQVIAESMGVRERPYLVYPGIGAIGEKFTDSSFPSGHVSSVVALSFVFVYFYRFLLFPALFFDLFVGFSRIHNGMHYPSDVLFGAFFGIIYGLLAIYIYKRFFSVFDKGILRNAFSRKLRKKMI